MVSTCIKLRFGTSRSREGAWIEISSFAKCPCPARRRSREGAWIEIRNRLQTYGQRTVAPARERGLKYCCIIIYLSFKCRSREGAWIEIFLHLLVSLLLGCRSREGAWIEMSSGPASLRTRSLSLPRGSVD